MPSIFFLLHCTKWFLVIFGSFATDDTKKIYLSTSLEVILYSMSFDGFCYKYRNGKPYERYERWCDIFFRKEYLGHSFFLFCYSRKLVSLLSFFLVVKIQIWDVLVEHWQQFLCHFSRLNIFHFFSRWGSFRQQLVFFVEWR